MNINTTSYNRNQSFGMSFERPNKYVIAHFKKAISELPENERTNFVDNVEKIVKNNSEIPVTITQEIDGAKYRTIVGNTCYYATQAKTKADAILTSMQRAASEAKNIANINKNMERINNIFDIKI